MLLVKFFGVFIGIIFFIRFCFYIIDKFDNKKDKINIHHKVCTRVQPYPNGNNKFIVCNFRCDGNCKFDKNKI